MASGRLAAVLAAGQRRLAATKVFDDPGIPWENRDDLVLGGCREGTIVETDCYDTWSKDLLYAVQDQIYSDTIVLLSVGAGVHELRTLRMIQGVRGTDGGATDALDKRGVFRPGTQYTPIKRVWLIDPGLDKETGDQVARKFMEVLQGVQVHYFTGDDAYVDAKQLAASLAPGDVAAIGALNASYGLLAHGDVSSILARMNLLHFLESVEPRYAPRDPPLRVVQAWRSPNRNWHTNQTVDEFTTEESYKLAMMQTMNLG